MTTMLPDASVSSILSITVKSSDLRSAGVSP